MGLGKTLQSIAFLSLVLEKGRSNEPSVNDGTLPNRPCPVLLVTPASVMQQWTEEIHRWTSIPLVSPDSSSIPPYPPWKVGLYHGQRGNRLFVLRQAAQGKLDVVLTSYETFRRDFKELNAFDDQYRGPSQRNNNNKASAVSSSPSSSSSLSDSLSWSWSACLFDEVHRLKDPSTRLSQAAKLLRCQRRFGLTGTVMQNRLEELWNLIDWAQPGHLGSLDFFRNDYVGPIKFGQRYDASPLEIALARRASLTLSLHVKSLVLRRDKSIIRDLLPGKEDTVVFCPLSPVWQSEIYQGVMQLPEFQLMVRYTETCRCGSGLHRGKCHGAFTDDGEEVRGLLLQSVSRLQKLANHPFLLLPDPKHPEERQGRDLVFLKRAVGSENESLFRRLQQQNPEDLEKCCGKLGTLALLLPLWRRQNKKVLLFSKSTRMLDLLGYWLDTKSCRYCRFDGSLSIARRKAVLQEVYINLTMTHKNNKPCS
jgi:SNF2 family DNA or RNA helicase